MEKVRGLGEWGTSVDPMFVAPKTVVRVVHPDGCRKCSEKAFKMASPVYKDLGMRVGKDTGLPERALVPVAHRFLCSDLSCGTITKVKF